MGNKPDLSVIIAARNEEFLQRTIDDVLTNSRGNTEVIAILDGCWPKEPISMHEKVTIVHYENSIGQRAACNEGAKLSQAKYIMKLDAHCAMDEGFDVKLMENIEYDWTVIPKQYNLHAFNWVCKKCGHARYQGREEFECPQCDNTTDYEKEMVWKPRRGTGQCFYRFDEEMKFQYWREYKTRSNVNKGQFVETMSLLGACWMMHRDRFWDLDGLDEKHGSWGQMGTEIACKVWLSGGRLLTNKNTWYAHMFRTQGGDFGFPYPIKASDQHETRKYSQDLWKNNKWPKQHHKLEWLIDKFSPVPGWEGQKELISKQLSKDAIEKGKFHVARLREKMPNVSVTKGLVYYTDNQCEERIADIARKQLERCNNGYPIVSVSQYPIDFGNNVVLPISRSVLSMFKQILVGIERIDTDIVFLVEHDVLYHPSHFDFVPPRKDRFYYNVNTWKVRPKDGQALFYFTQQVSGLCAYRELLIEHYKKKIERVEREGFTRRLGFEPGNHPFPRGVDNYKAESWRSEHPNVDIRHGKNVSGCRFSKDQFRRQPKEWVLADDIPFWGKTKGRFDDFLRELQ